LRDPSDERLEAASAVKISTDAGEFPNARQPADKPLAVLIPGMDGTGLLFYRQIPFLARRFRVVTHRLDDERTRMEDLVSDLARRLDELDPDGQPALLVGESFGGALALSFALAHPARVAGLVIVNSFPFFSPQVRLRAAIHGLSLLPWGAMPIVRRATAWRMHSRHTHRADLETFLELMQHTTRLGYVNRLRILTAYDVRHRLAEIGTPTLFLAASDDHLVPAVREARRMALSVPRAAVRVLDGHGHICLIAPDLNLLEIIEAWQQGLDAG
jgi:pimeloyl-ACP methyl ester carboxylesterase